MLKDLDWSNNVSYRTGSDSEPVEFYLKGLSNSTQLDLLLGYFSSGAIHLLSIGFAKFLHSGGRVRMIINNVLSQFDKEAIQFGLNENISVSIDITDIKNLRRSLDSYGKHFFECLAWLIANKKIDIVIIKPKTGSGIAHYKSGVFRDENNQVGFKASCNFTSFGLAENLEELDSYFSWENGRSEVWLQSQNAYFEEIFTGRADFVEYLDVSQVMIAVHSEFGDKNLNELIVQERDLLEQKKKILENRSVRKVIESIITNLESISRSPRFPYASGPHGYQVQAYQNWINNECNGIFSMATGTGKTITALNCVLNECIKKQFQTYHALILVPTLTLVEQWENEARSFNFTEIYRISSKENWQTSVSTLMSTANRIEVSFIIISTYASFSKDHFQKIFNSLPKDTILIADEGHNIASPGIINKLKTFPSPKRIGLTATPKRIYDPEGTAKMEEFFNEKEPYTFSFPMEKAIHEGVLCQYYYFPHLVTLTQTEMTSYAEISARITKLSRSTSLDAQQTIEKLLLARKRIIHKAENKLALTVDIAREKFLKDGNLKYTFVYVPEGDTFEINDPENDTPSNIKIINQYTREIAKISDKLLVNKYTSEMPDRQEILSQFEDGKIDIIASMKCLDEGVNIPRAETAIFCSSTGNPRQFIQRRGRILRKHPQKRYATIYDLVVIPSMEQQNSNTYDLEKSLVKKELERVMHFASLSKNPYFTEDQFQEVCSHYDLNIYSIQNELTSV